MTLMNSADIDLNLLRVLDALLDTGSVVGAAAQLHLSSPAVSRSLGRLRKVLDDPLFVRAGRELVPTELAKSLRVPTQAALGEVLKVLQPSRSSDPINLKRRFAIRADDSIIAVLAIPLMERVQMSAPGVDIDFLRDDPSYVTQFRTGELDFRIGVHAEEHRDTRSEVLLTDRFVAIVHKDHALAGRRLTNRKFADAHHVTVSPVGKRTGPIDVALAEIGLDRKHITTVTSFVVAAHLVATTDQVGSVPRTIAKTMARALPIVSLEIPLSLPTFDVCLTWHDRHSDDSAHQWLKSQIVDAVRDLG
jgi:DNA-binding transcriptional LysR family regulator